MEKNMKKEKAEKAKKSPQKPPQKKWWKETGTSKLHIYSPNRRQ
jgi:hypothetical protein